MSQTPKLIRSAEKLESPNALPIVVPAPLAVKLIGGTTRRAQNGQTMGPLKKFLRPRQ
jgi:hypothetical protein